MAMSLREFGLHLMKSAAGKLHHISGPVSSNSQNQKDLNDGCTPKCGGKLIYLHPARGTLGGLTLANSLTRLIGNCGFHWSNTGKMVIILNTAYSSMGYAYDMM